VVSHDGSSCAVTVQRFQYGVGWTITVPADGKNYRKQLAKARRQAFDTFFAMEYLLKGPAVDPLPRPAADLSEPAIKPAAYDGA
jgi:hypothetical protein